MNKFKITILLSGAVLLLAPLSVVAQDAGTSQESTLATIERKARITERNDIYESMPANVKNLVTAGCKDDQIEIGLSRDRLGYNVKKLTSSFAEISDKLSNIAEDSQGDTNDISENTVSEFETMLAKFYDAASSQEEALLDAISIDCVEEPQDYYFAVRSARDYSAIASGQFNELSSFVSDSVKGVINER